MRRSIWAILGVLVVLLCLGPRPVMSQENGVTLDQLIEPQQQLEMGLYKLTAEEKQALLNFILAVYQAGRDSAGALPPPTAGHSVTPTTPFLAAPSLHSAGESHWLTENVGPGEVVILDDGSAWTVNPMATFDALLWLPTEHVVITDGSADCLAGELLLVNIDQGERVCARPLGSR